MRSVWAFGVIALVLGSLNSPRCAADDAPGFRVATFRCDATPPLGSPTYGGKPLETIETPLLAKGIVLEAAEQRYVLCAVDWCGLCGQAHDLFRRGIAQGADTDISRVAVHTVHQHTAPYISVGDITIRDRHGNPPQGVDPQVVRDVAARLEQAVSASLETLQPFDTVGHGQAKVDRVASARRIWKDGKILTRWSSCTDPALRAEPEGNIDPMLKTITLAAGKKPLVRIHYYTTHPQSFYGDPRVCYDVPGFARERLEEQEGVFQIYFTGCAGDVVMGKYNDRTPQARSELTDRLFAGMQASIQATAFAPVNRLAWRSIPLSLPPKQDADTAAAEDSEPNADAEAADKQRMKSLRSRDPCRLAAEITGCESIGDRSGSDRAFARRMSHRISTLHSGARTKPIYRGGSVWRLGARLYLPGAGIRGRWLRTECLECEAGVGNCAESGDSAVADRQLALTFPRQLPDVIPMRIK
jgi:hypothetical protein